MVSLGRYLGGALLEGGSETTSLFLQSLIQALVIRPEVQKKAHDEIDRVIGRNRVPELKDMEHLPYLQAIVKEVLWQPFICSFTSSMNVLQTHRFRPVAPLALPHLLLADEKVTTYFLVIFASSCDLCCAYRSTTMSSLKER